MSTRNKTIKFNMNNEYDRTLFEFLETRAHGSFSEKTKTFWHLQMLNELNGGSQEEVKRIKLEQVNDPLSVREELQQKISGGKNK